jgi:hypothetical protein
MTPSTELTKDPLTVIQAADQMSDPIPTPRVDAAAYDSQPGNPMVPNGCAVVPADFARELERELFHARQAALSEGIRSGELEKDRERDRGLRIAVSEWLKEREQKGYMVRDEGEKEVMRLMDPRNQAVIDAAMKGEAGGLD